MSDIFYYGQDRLTTKIALGIAQGHISGQLAESTKAKIQKSANVVMKIADGNKSVYGINTGFGPLCTTMISKEKTVALQHNILMSHAVGVGEPIDDQLSKLMMILKVQALAQGFSGVQLSTLARIIWHIDHDVIPVVPSQGSVGASGDLAPLSHLFLPLIGYGHVMVDDVRLSTQEALAAHGLSSLTLSPKEGLGLINGTQFIAAHAVLVVDKMHNLITSANITGAMMIEGLLGSIKPFSPELHELRPFPANQYVAHFLMNLLEESEVVNSHTNCTRVQDPYSLRCIPQVHGASLASWLHLKELLEIELNSVTDNPVVFDENHTISGGNFHGQPLAMALDYACLACSEIGNISDRRTYLSLEGDTPGVPKLLLKETGTNSGFMIPQYTAAALASENKGLCFPASADSIPTSLGQEDHVSMGSISGRKALRVINNVEKILGIELFCAAQALDFHRPLKSSKYMSLLHDFIRKSIPHLERDQIMSDFMQVAIGIIEQGELKSIIKSDMMSNPWSESFDKY